MGGGGRQFRFMELIHMTFEEFNCSVSNAVPTVWKCSLILAHRSRRFRPDILVSIENYKLKQEITNYILTF